MSGRMRLLGLVIALPVVGAVAVWGLGYAEFAARALPVGVGLSAKQLCSLHFVSGLPVDRARALYVDRIVEPLPPFLEVEVDAETRTLVASGLGTTSTARFRDGYGCILDIDDRPLPDPRAARTPAPPDQLDAAHRKARFDAAALEAALDAAFENPEDARNTLAVAVYDGDRLVAERYADGITNQTPLPGWSMTKSVTATLAGMAVSQGHLAHQAPGVIREWRGTDDPRAAISLDHLLRMTSGLLLTEDQTGVDVNSQLLFLEADAAAFAARQPLVHEVGSHYEYMSGSTVLAARAIADAYGNSAKTTFDFVEANLFGPLGMTTAHLEPDQAGTPIGSSFMLASAQDWARIGRLYLHRGSWKGNQILPQWWIDHVLTWTPESGNWPYGAGFWLNEFPEGMRYPSLPADAFAMQGFQGQWVWIVPSKNLVVVRLGATAGVSDGAVSLLRNVVAAHRT